MTFARDRAGRVYRFEGGRWIPLPPKRGATSTAPVRFVNRRPTRRPGPLPLRTAPAAVQRVVQSVAAQLGIPPIHDYANGGAVSNVSAFASNPGSLLVGNFVAMVDELFGDGPPVATPAEVTNVGPVGHLVAHETY